MSSWLRDRWGVPWQIVPEILPRLLADPDPAASARVFAAMTEMVKLDVAAWSVRPPDEGRYQVSDFDH